ncbi:uncharacterized protein METZ01_LOCUS95268 [marine metagenome]|uniref:Uncharacterized protein n=1 Tax=marine metagenome TaxID=408172 RepID=A0A381VQC0_9ZZZZ
MPITIKIIGLNALKVLKMSLKEGSDAPNALI